MQFFHDKIVMAMGLSVKLSPDLFVVSYIQRYLSQADLINNYVQGLKFGLTFNFPFFLNGSELET